MPSSPSMPPGWHDGPSNGFHGKITPDGPFQPEQDRYHLYIALFCPFAQRVNIALELKGINEAAGIGTSIARPFPLGDENGFPGWRFNVEDDTENEEKNYPGSTVDPLYGSKYMSDLYFRADPGYKGRYSVPVLWDKKLETIVSNDSRDLLQHIHKAFDVLLSPALAAIDLFPTSHRADIYEIGEWMHQDLNVGVYKAGFAKQQAAYEDGLRSVYTALNKIERLLHSNGGPFVLGKSLTILDIQLFTTLIRFDPVYVQYFACNLGDVRHDYPVLHEWLKMLYWNASGRMEAFQTTTNFDHIKTSYYRSRPEFNPRGIVPCGPYPDIQEGLSAGLAGILPGYVDVGRVLDKAS